MERCSFFNAELVGEEYDRVYLAEDFARYFSSFIGNGVFPNPATGLQVVADNKSMNVTIKQGKAWINGYFYENTDDLILQVNVADGVLNRIDKVVLRLDFLNREIKAYIKQGNFASVPVTPTITRNADMYEIALADIKINRGVIKITQADITDLRFNKNVCGVVRGTVDEIDTTNLFAQYQDSFNSWFENVKGQLGGDIAGNLQNQITEIKNSKGQPNGLATLDENGIIPQSQIGIMAGVDLLYSGGNEAPPTVTIMNIPTEYKYYELLIYGKGGYTAKNSLKINDLLIREVYTSSNEGFFMKAIITDKVYCSASANESYYDAVLPGDAMSNFKEGIFIGNKLNKITIDTTASTSGEIRYITLLGYK